MQENGISGRMLDVLLRGISTRQYAEVLPEMASSCGVSKSNVSREAAEAGEVKPDCSSALRRKRLQSLPVEISRTLSPVRFESKSSEIAPISCNFQSNPGGFLCTSDCVAEQAVWR
jgi:hypothetical protein